jgi:predicted Rossmann fold flavoprotein
VVAEHKRRGPVSLEADILADATFEELRDEIIAWSTSNPKRHVLAWLEGKVPASIAPDLLLGSGIARDQLAGVLDKKARNRLVEALKGWKIGDARHVPLEKGEVVAGGVSLDEVDPQTMQSKIVPNLFLCGEILDIAGPVGGYNLQAAFSTGYVAGDSAARLVGRP